MVGLCQSSSFLLFVAFFLRRLSSSAANLSRRPSQMARYAVTNLDSSWNGSGRSAYRRLRPSGLTTTKLASSRIASCRETPGCPMSTISTSWLTDRSPSRRASTRRRRVGSARIWKTSGTSTYYCNNIYRVNDILGTDAVELAQLGQHLGDLLGQGHGLIPANVDDLLCDPELEQAAREVDQSVAVLAVPVELERPPDLSVIPSYRAARLFEFRDQRLDFVGTAS